MKRILSESNIGTYYHITDINNAIKIIRSNSFKGKDEERNMNIRFGRARFNVCLSRNKTIRQGYGLHFWREQQCNVVYLTINGDFINSRYKIKPFDFLGASHGPYKNNEVQCGRQVYKNSLIGRGNVGKTDWDVTHYNCMDEDEGWSESEERMFLKKETAKLGKDTIICADVILNWEHYIDEALQMLQKDCDDFSPQWNFRIEVLNLYNKLATIDNYMGVVEDIKEIYKYVPNVNIYSTYSDFDNKKPLPFEAILTRLHQKLDKISHLYEDLVNKIYDTCELAKNYLMMIETGYSFINQLLYMTEC